MPRIVLKEHDSDKTLEAERTDAVIGRDPTAPFQIEGPNSKVVSARHARVFYADSAWWIEDTSRNGTILDDERLQPGQRHAIKPGQLIGLGESGPRYQVVTLDASKVSETVMEPGLADAVAPKSTTAPRQPAASRPAPPPAQLPTAALRKSEAMRAGLKFEEETEPAAPSPDWLVHIILRATNTNQHYELRAEVVKLGRSPECNIQVPPELGASVSRVHAEILIDDGGVTLRDAGSRNGTFINGRRVDSPHSVARNDLIMLGSGGPTFSIEDLHIVKGPSRPVSGGGGAEDLGESTPKSARPIPGYAPSPGLSRHTSYRSEPPTAPAKGKPVGASAVSEGFSRNVLEDMSGKGARRTRIFIWAGLAALLAVAATLLLRSR